MNYSSDTKNRKDHEIICHHAAVDEYENVHGYEYDEDVLLDYHDDDDDDVYGDYDFTLNSQRGCSGSGGGNKKNRTNKEGGSGSSSSGGKGIYSQKHVRIQESMRENSKKYRNSNNHKGSCQNRYSTVR